MLGSKSVRFEAGEQASPNQVDAEFLVQSATFGNDPNPVVTLSPTALESSGDDPVLGKVTYTLDKDRQPEAATTVTSNAGASGFPADINIYAPVLARADNQPGRTYRSIGDVHLQSLSASSFNPFTGADPFTLVAPVDFEDVEFPGIVAFTLTAATLN